MISIIIVICTIFLPSLAHGEHSYLFGYPFRFFSIYDSITNIKPSDTLLKFVKIDVMLFVVNIFIVNIILNVLEKVSPNKG